MSNHDMITDDYVADLLAKEAIMGPADKKPANMPKPNTRFLRHIIKDTNTHNQNLLAKEAAESRARLKDLEHAEEKERRRRAGPQDIRKRQMGDIMSILGDCKDRGRSSRSRRSDEKSQKKESSPPPRRKHHKERRSESPERESSRRHHRSRKDESESEREDRRRHRNDRRRSRSPDEKHRRHRHRSPIDDRQTTSKSRRSDRGRIRDEEGRDLMSRSHRIRKDRSRERPQSEFSIKGSSRRRRDEGKAQDRELATTASDSDPLDEFIGPEPPQPVRSRGRGTASGTLGIDKRFEADYNPKTDVEMADNDKHPGENWDDAVEAFRDRQKWRQNQEQRMRAAGYSDEMIKKWTEGGTAGEQKDERDVRWAKAGEKREWDRGKEVGLSWASSESK